MALLFVLDRPKAQARGSFGDMRLYITNLQWPRSSFWIVCASQALSTFKDIIFNLLLISLWKLRLEPTFSHIQVTNIIPKSVTLRYSVREMVRPHKLRNVGAGPLLTLGKPGRSACGSSTLSAKLIMSSSLRLVYFPKYGSPSFIHQPAVTTTTSAVYFPKPGSDSPSFSLQSLLLFASHPIP